MYENNISRSLKSKFDYGLLLQSTLHRNFDNTRTCTTPREEDQPSSAFSPVSANTFIRGLIVRKGVEEYHQTTLTYTEVCFQDVYNLAGS